MSSQTAASGVARVSWLTSDALLDLLPSHLSRSMFASPYAQLSSVASVHPKLQTVPSNADPVAHISSSSTLTTITLSYDSAALTGLVPHLPRVAAFPLVIHVAVDGDTSDVVALRSAVPFYLHSSTVQQAQDHALIAARLAKFEKKAVVHVFSNSAAADLRALGEKDVEAFLVASESSIIDDEHARGAVFDTSLSKVDEAGSELYKAYELAALSFSGLSGRNAVPYSLTSSEEASTLLLSLGEVSPHPLPTLPDGVATLSVFLFRPFPVSQLLSAIPSSVTRIVVLERVYKRTTKWTPLYLDVISALQEWSGDRRPEVFSATLGHVDEAEFSSELQALLSSLSSHGPSVLGKLPSTPTGAPLIPRVPRHEASYTNLLSHLFPGRLEISNSPELVSTLGDAATRPEFALGQVRAQEESGAALEQAVRDLVETPGVVDAELHALLGKWLLAKEDTIRSGPLGDEIIASLEKTAVDHPSASTILELRSHFAAPSRWIIGSDAWSYDLGASGLHHLISSSLNVNILLLDTQPYTARSATDPTKRKKDAGLYAMNYGHAYVGSIAVYSSYSQALQALIEADRFKGPSVILAYLPYESEETSALSVLKETKLAVDAGYWPLYRWDPSKDQKGDEPFALDSEAIKADLREFLDRQNHLSQLTLSTPALATELVSSLGSELKDARKKQAQAAFDALVNAMEGPPLFVLYASDGGNAEKIAKRLATRAKARGLSVRCGTLDSVPLDDIAREDREGTTFAFITSTAGQGEPPQNGRDTFKALNAAFTRSEKPFAPGAEGQAEESPVGLRYSVFGMGDSHYWPRPEDAVYYNKPGKDLDARLEQLGGERIAALGLGDDQDADGPQTGYKAWEPLLWKALGVDTVEVTEAEPEPVTNENIKIASNFLRGTIAEGLVDESTGALAPSDGQLTKFHGIYEQDDRDIRDERKAEGLEPAYAFMIRVRMPGGVCQPKQWLAMDRIADERGNGTFKLTTRQTFQFHGVIKKHLKPSIQAINRALLDTIAACGDVNRNVLVSSLPSLSHLHEQAYAFAKNISEHLLPKTTAYHEIWLDKKLVGGDAVKDYEPLYGPFYLPRKFKIAVAIPPNNDVDIFANDLGFIAITDDKNKLTGFNVTAGGGMGVTHSNKKTYPRLGDVLGFCTPEQGHLVAEKIMLTQRDNGNRADRKNARLKYTIDRMGLDKFKAEVEKRLGFALEPARPFTFDSNVDDFGWTVGHDGKHHFTMFIENGRVQDEPGKEFKTGLREIAKVHKGTFRLTANQHVILSDIDPEDVPEMKRLLAKYKLDNLSQSGLRLSSSACVAFPTCGLAMAESERYLPILIDKVEKICEENGLRNDSIVMRMTGCPNGCARPYIAEVAFVGKAPGSYLMLLGGGYHGQRLNKIYRENVTEPEILAILKPMIKRYALERHAGEHFGDFVIRAGYIAPTTEGKAWYDRMGGEGEYREATTS